MLNLVPISVILIILTIAVHSHARDVISGKVVGVSDGDTITVLENRIQHKMQRTRCVNSGLSEHVFGLEGFA